MAKSKLAKSKHLAELADVGSYAFLLGLAYVGCYLAIGDPFDYGGPCFATMLIWAGAHAGGILFGIFRLPPLLGMLLSGMILQNAAPSVVAPLPKEWSKGFRAVALGTIFLRSGFELDLEVFKKVGPAAVRLLLIPGLVEAFVTGTMAHLVFGMPILLGFTLGFILKAVGPAVVIQTMFDVQTAGYGVEKGIPSIVVGAASFDDMVALTGYSLFSNLALAQGKGGKLVYKMFHGPLDLVLGITAGMLGAMLCSLTAVWNTRLKRQGVTFITAMVLLFTLYHFEFNAGGALSCIVLGLFTNLFWERGIHFFYLPGFASTGPSSTYGHEVEHMVGKFWRFFAQPLLFGIIGTLMNFSKLEASTIPLSMAVVAVGIVVRMPTTFMAMTGAGLTLKERLFVACAWTPKATVQAALAAAPLDLIKAAKRDDLLKYGDQILTTAVFAILLCAPLGVLLIHFFAPRLLQQAPHHHKSHVLPPHEEAQDEGEDDSRMPSHTSHRPQRPPQQPPGPPLDGHRTESADLRNRMVHMVHDPLVSYIQGTESGILPAPSSPSSDEPGSPWGVTMRRTATSPAALVTMDKDVAAREAPAQQGAALITTTHDAHSTFDSRISVDSEQASRSDAGPASRLQEEASKQQQQLEAQDGAAAAYLRSIERLAEVVESQALLTPAASAAHAAQLREAVRSLRQRLVEGSSEVEETEESAETARAFFRRAQGATSLPQVDQVLESLQVYVCGGGTKN